MMPLMDVILILFLSTLSLRRATWARGSRVTYIEISIHALLAESDNRLLRRYQNMSSFLSTLSLRRATYFSAVMRQNPGISIHALLAESDSKSAQNSGALLRI